MSDNPALKGGLFIGGQHYKYSDLEQGPDGKWRLPKRRRAAASKPAEPAEDKQAEASSDKSASPALDKQASADSDKGDDAESSSSKAFRRKGNTDTGKRNP